MKSVIFKNCNLLDVENSNVISGIDVLTEDNLITKISESSIKSKNSIELDCTGKTLMPGLIDAHVHITATALDMSTISTYPHSLNVLRSAKLAESMLMRGSCNIPDCTCQQFLDAFEEIDDEQL